MVEHMSGAIQTTHQHQSFNGVQTQRWHHRHHHHHSESPDLTIKVTTSKNHRFSLFKWFKRRDSTSSADNHHRRRHIFRRAKRRPSTSSTSSSVDTFYSTATVRSFAFHSGVRRSAANAALKLEQASGTAVGPFAPGACKLIEKREFRDDEIRRIDAATTSTLPSAFLQRQDLQTRYSLLPVSSPFISYDSIPVVDRRPRTFAESRRTNNNKNNTTIDVVIDTLTSDSSASGARRVHVKGKRRAPDPPTQRIISVHVASASGCSKPAGGGRRKRRPAPKPPGYTETLSSNQDTLSSEASLGMDSFLTTRESPIISNDTLVLRRGVLLSKKDVRSSTSRSRTPTTSVCDSDGGTIASNQSTVTSVGNQSPKIGTIMPRPWYKRNSDHSSHSNTRDSSTNTRRTGGDYILRGLSSPIPSEIKIEDITPSPTSTSSTLSSSFPFEGSLSRLGFFHRGDRHHHDDKKKENKRKSGVSILTNISELDKEAAAIVQEEQARNRASMLLQAAKLDEEFERRMGANEEIVQEIVNSSMESSPRRSTRALISKFNALGNITNGNFFGKNNSASPKAKNKRYSQECNGRQNSTIDEKLEKDLSRYFLPHHSSPKRDSAAIFTEVINPGRPKTTSTDVKPITMTTTAMTTTLNDSTAKTVPITITTTPLIINTSKVTSIPIITPVVNMPTTTNVPITLTTPTVKTTPVTTSSTTTSSKIGTQDDDAEFVKTLAAELDDVASGIAKLRRELDDRPRLIDSVSPEKEKVIPEKKKASEVLNKPNAAKERDLAKFDKEFTKIFDEIDRQLKTRDIRIPQTRTSANASETSISNQVAKVLDILVGAEKDAAKNFAQSSKETNKSMDSENTANKEPKPRVQRISGVDDKTTAELKEMLKEMKHSLPKRPKPKRNTEADEKLQDAKKPAELINNKPSSSVYHVTEEIKIPQPKVSTKVSSGVQTSGNVRRIEISPRPKESNVIPEIPKAAAAAVAAARNNSTYQLIKANEFEAAKSKARLESAYANVIERSLYANAQADEPFAARAKIDLRPGDSGVNATASTTTANSSPLPHRAERKGSLGADKNDSNEEGEKLEEIKKQYMNTLAVNRLLRKLEAAIASGNHQQAAVLAKELAQLKIHCSVVRQRSCSAKEKLNLSMYIEDKQAHQGPIPLQLPAKMTVAQLKAKIHIEFEIPANVQRWIIGKNLADNDESTLEELQAVEGSPVFLYLVAPPDLQDKEVTKVDKRDEEKAIEVEEVEVERASSEEKNDEPVVHEIKTEIEPRPMPVPAVVQETATAKTTTDNEAQQPQAQENEDDDSLTKEEKLKRYEELMSLENCDVILNTEPIECPVCFMITIPGEGVILRDCLHSFCRMCVANTVRYCEEAEVKCPYRDADYTCESTLQEREIKALVAPEVYQQHLAKSIAQAENNAGNNAFHCKTPDCPGWCIYDDNVNNFLCPVCKVNNCLTCQAIHMGKNCRQYQEELKYSKDTDHESKRTAAMLEEMVDRGEALPCPTCAVVLMKKWGCDWLRCSMCKTEICWVTRGPRWGPGGKGDTSGGCRCGENGVKCHPKCNYCH